MDRLEELLQFLKKFNEDRDWRQFHSENNLAKSIVLEANELLTEFQFDSNNHLLERTFYIISMSYK